MNADIIHSVSTFRPGVVLVETGDKRRFLICARDTYGLLPKIGQLITDYRSATPFRREYTCLQCGSSHFSTARLLNNKQYIRCSDQLNLKCMGCWVLTFDENNKLLDREDYDHQRFYNEIFNRS